MNICKQCNKKTKNNKFCSRSCSATYNNKKYPRKTAKKWFCETCDIEVPSRRRFCVQHNNNITDWSITTVGSIRNRYKYQKNARFRALTVLLYKNHKDYQSCSRCPYDKHVEFHHIKSLSSFSDNDMVSDMVKESNILALCPNCHWEEHNGAPTQSRTEH